jgi:hypothetical protein
MKTEQLVRPVTLEGQQFNVAVGDVEFWFQQAQLNSTPHVATVLELLDDNMVTLAVTTHTEQVKIVRYTGVCLAGDERLKNPNYVKRGAWCPRFLFSFLVDKVKD